MKKLTVALAALSALGTLYHRTQDWAGLVLLSPENVAYATGFVVPSQPLMRTVR